MQMEFVPGNGVPRKVFWSNLKRKRVMKREVFAITKICKYIKISIKTDGKRCKNFEVKIVFHQDPVFSPLLFVLVMNKITKDVRESGVKELLYSGNLCCFGIARKKYKKVTHGKRNIRKMV